MAAHHIAKYIRHAPPVKAHTSKSIIYLSKALGATMWFTIFYRVKEDGAVMFGFKLPTE